jgi:hypothetical protein
MLFNENHGERSEFYRYDTGKVGIREPGGWGKVANLPNIKLGLEYVFAENVQSADIPNRLTV